MVSKNESRFTIENDILKSNDFCYTNDYTSLGEFVLDRLESNENFVGQINAVTGEEYTYKKMRERSVRCALWMKSQGLLPGDVVAICSHSHLDITMPCFGALYLGAVTTSWNAGSTAKELHHMMTMYKPKMVFVTKESVTLITEASKEAKLNLKIIVFGQVEGLLEFENIIAEPDVNEAKNFTCLKIANPDTTTFIVITSGTTGPRKGVVLSHIAILRQTYLQGKILDIANGVYLSYSTISWITGLTQVFWSLFAYAVKIVVTTFDLHSMCALIEKHKVNLLLMTPAIIHNLLKFNSLNKYNLSSVKRIYWGGRPLAIARQEALAELLPNVIITPLYGMTELCGIFSALTINSKLGSGGRIVGNGQLKVIDLNTGRILGANEQGELLLKSDCMMNCYYNNPEATAKTIDKEGWLHSGDFGYYDKDGDIFVIDRLKDLIKYRGYRISPSEIEDVILSHPGVKDVGVIGLPNSQDGEHPIAFVVRAVDSANAGNEVTEVELIKFVNAKMTDTNQLRGGVKFLDRISKTHSGKVKRDELRDLISSMITN